MAGQTMRVATDIGGTFTDVVTIEDESIRGGKVLSTPGRPHEAIIDLIQTLGPVSSFSHGTTVATNAILERKGAQTAFITTEGFKDLLYIARQKRPRLYDFDCARPVPLVRRDLCFEAPERIGPDGKIIKPLTEADVTRLVDAVVDSGAESVAICLLFSYKNPIHEIRLEEGFRKQGLPVSLSSRVIPEFREFERASTTTINAFLHPRVNAYLQRIRDALFGLGGTRDFHVMKSCGGVATTSEIHPVELILSGPAGGVSAALRLGQEMERHNIITFDMGGTSADFSAIHRGKPVWTEDGHIDGLPVRLPIIDITTVGAGGGSIAWLDEGGALRVGPQSTGSEPGPAGYDRGGTHPTVTDANLLSGLLDPHSFAVAEIRLNCNRARQAFQTLSAHAGLSDHETIVGVRSVVNANMLRGIRKATVEKGIDTRQCTLLAFGGAGPLHAAELAEALGIKEVLIPPMAGMFSALGILLAKARLLFGKSLLVPLDGSEANIVNTALDEFTTRAMDSFKRQGLGHERAFVYPSLDLRYRGQSFHLTVDYDGRVDMANRFHQTFENRYGYCLRDIPVEIVSVKLLAIADRPYTMPITGRDHSPKGPAQVREVLLPSGRRTAVVYKRHALSNGLTVQGPAIVEDEGCTIFVPPDCEVSPTQNDCLKISIA